MKDFKSYQNEKQNRSAARNQAKINENSSAFANRNENGLSTESDEAKELARRALSALDGKSENAVLYEILRRAEEGKRNGTLTDADIDAFYAQFAPMLNDAQRKKLKSVAERLKKL